MKLVLFALLAAIACRMIFGAWPWQLWRRSERSQREAQARSLLGVAPRAGREEILAAHRRALRDAHPDRGGSAEAVHRLDLARDILLEQTGRSPHHR